MLVTSIFSFFHKIFNAIKDKDHHSIKDKNNHFSNITFVVCRCFQFGPGQNFVIYLPITTQYRIFDTLKIYSCGKHCKKKKIACNKQFLLFSQCFLHLFFFLKALQNLVCCNFFFPIWTSLQLCRLVIG